MGFDVDAHGHRNLSKPLRLLHGIPVRIGKPEDIVAADLGVHHKRRMSMKE
jgi:hypothetical protein